MCAFVCRGGENSGGEVAAAAVAALDLTSDSASVAPASVAAVSIVPDSVRKCQGAPAAPLSQRTFAEYDGFAALQSEQNAAIASAAARRFSALPAAMLAKPLPAGVDSEPAYGKCPLVDCQLQRIAKMTSASKGANYLRYFLTCRLSSHGNAHNTAAFGWRDEWLEQRKLPLKPADIAWRQRQASIAAQLAAGKLPTEIYGPPSQ